MWCAGVVSSSCGWCVVLGYGSCAARGSFLVSRRACCSRVAAVPSPLVYFERRIANGHGFARVYRDLISNIYNYGLPVVASRRKIDNKTINVVFRSDQHHTARSRMDTVRDANRTAAVEHQYTHRAHSRACRIPDALGHPCVIPVKRPPRRHGRAGGVERGWHRECGHGPCTEPHAYCKTPLKRAIAESSCCMLTQPCGCFVLSLCPRQAIRSNQYDWES